MNLYTVEMSGINYTRDGNHPISRTLYIVASNVDEATERANDMDRQMRVDRVSESQRVDSIVIPDNYTP